MSNTGGPAFPTGTGGNTPYSKGMTLRDYFAAKAMQAVFTGAIMDGLAMNQDIERDKLAIIAYTMADDMLKARGTP